MKLFGKVNSQQVIALACGFGLAVSVLAWRAHATEWDKMTILTVSQPVQVTDRVLLQPGQYTLRLLNSESNRHVVQIFNGDRTHIINTVIAIPAYRLNPKGDSTFSFYETPPGYAKALHKWFYPGDNYGQEFAYPKQLALLTASTTGAEAAQTTQQQTETQAETTPPPAPAETENQVTETAQATPPPAPEQAPEAQPPAPAPQTQPESLPKTATPYPAIGLAGLVSLALYGLLRLKRFV